MIKLTVKDTISGKLSQFVRWLKQEESVQKSSAAQHLKDELRRQVQSWTKNPTGQLKNSFFVARQGFSTEVRSNSDYAAIHNFGGKTGWEKRITIQAQHYVEAAVDITNKKANNDFKIAIAKKKP